ncbi:hypothetical protein [Anaerotignum sp.]
MGKSRNENIIENMLGAENELEEPKSRNEKLLMQLLDQTIIVGNISAKDDGNGTVTLETDEVK